MTTDGDKPDSKVSCRSPLGGTGFLNGGGCDSPPQDLPVMDENENNCFTEEPTDSNDSLQESSKKKRRRRQTISQRKAANMRERRRMRLLNQAFDRLKRHLPNTADHNRLSRMQTLKAAIVYIEYLSSLT